MSLEPHLATGPNAILAEHFRLAEEIAAWHTQPLELAPPGFFRLGEDTVVYGRLAGIPAADRPEEANQDALSAIETGGGTVRLPFAAGEVLANLLHERYPGAAPAAGAGHLLRRSAEVVYYGLRPLLPVALRKHVQRAAVLRHGEAAHQFPAWPVDTTAERLLDRLLWLAMRAGGVDRLPFIWFWPDGHAAAVVMTHDVETAAGRDFAPELMDLDDSFGLKASFEVIPERRYGVPEAWLRNVRERGFEINVHDLNHDGRLFSRRDEFLRRAAKINAYGQLWGARGFRSGVLYRNLDWMGALRFDYDMSQPNGGHFQPQTGGCCAVRPFFNGDLVEIPGTAAQDYILFHILGDYSLAIWERQMQSIAGAHGVICFSCHPDYLIESRARAVYAALLARLAEERRREAWWFALPGEVAAWWRQRRQMRLVASGGEWRIEGAGSDRACIAYAEAGADGLRYALPAAAAPVAGCAANRVSG